MMRGSVRRRGSKWEWRARTPEGRNISKGGFDTQTAAEEALVKALASIFDYRFVNPSKLTVHMYLDQIWLPAVKSTLSPSTHANYEIIIRRHIEKRIGDVPLQKLTEAHLMRLYADLAKDGHRYSKDDAPKGLASKSIRHVHTMLHRALDDAVEWRYAQRNVADSRRAKPPRPKKNTDLNTWSASELQTFLASQADDRLYPLWRFMAMTGVRRGEALGLKWGSVDLEGGVVSIDRSRTIHGESTPKTDRSRRSIDLDPETVRLLKEWRKRQLI